MKKYIIGLIILIIIIIAGIGIYNFSKSSNLNNSQEQAKETTVKVIKLDNNNQNMIKVTGFPYINNYVLNDILKMNDINGVDLDINIVNNPYNGIEASQILNECEKALKINIPQKNIELANILLATSTGLDRVETQENVSKLVMQTNEFYKQYHSSSGLYMGGPNKLLDKYSTKIKNNDGEDSLYVQMCIFLNEFYNNYNGISKVTKSSNNEGKISSIKTNSNENNSTNNNVNNNTDNSLND